MITKTCISCNREKDICDFRFKIRPKRTAKCKDCLKQYDKEGYKTRYAKDKPSRIQRVAKARNRNLKYILQYLSDKVCKDCGYSDIRALEFDHLSSKYLEVPTMANSGYSIESINNEINKCEIVCSNCHRIRTAERGNTYRQKYMLELGGGGPNPVRQKIATLRMCVQLAPATP